MNYNFSDKTVLITGAGRGIGKAIADEFAKEKAKLILVSISNNVFQTAEKLRENTNVLSYKGNISNGFFVKNVIQEAINYFGKIDILVNAAAIIGPTGKIFDVDPVEWQKTININLFGTFLTMNMVLKDMIKRKSGKIINFAGGGAAYSYPNFTAYASSKVAVVRLTETVADEVCQFNIQVNSIAPGAVETDMLKQTRDAGGEIKTIVTIDKPVKLVLFLASDKSNHITGRFIHSNDPYYDFPIEMKKDEYKLRRIPLR